MRGPMLWRFIAAGVCFVAGILALVGYCIFAYFQYFNEIPKPGFRAAIGGSLSHCPVGVLLASEFPPKSVHRLRPADIGIIAAMGDSITAGYISNNGPGTDFVDDAFYFPGNSFDIGGAENLTVHVTLPNILRTLNPGLSGYSNGIGMDLTNAHLNVAVGGRKSDDFPRQAKDLVDRLLAYPQRESEWKLVHMFIGTNDIRCGEEYISGADHKRYLREALTLLKAALPRTLVSIVAIWNVNFSYLAQVAIYGEERKVCPTGYAPIGQQYFEDYRRVVNEIEKEKEFESDNFTVVVQHIFDDLYEPMQDASGTILPDYYARDTFHLSKFGHSLVAKQLWRTLLEPVGSAGKRATYAQLADEGTQLACPSKECPYIRTVANSLNCD